MRKIVALPTFIACLTLLSGSILTAEKPGDYRDEPIEITTFGFSGGYMESIQHAVCILCRSERDEAYFDARANAIMTLSKACKERKGQVLRFPEDKDISEKGCKRYHTPLFEDPFQRLGYEYLGCKVSASVTCRVPKLQLKSETLTTLPDHAQEGLFAGN